MHTSQASYEEMRRVFEAYPEVLAVYLFGSRATDRARSDSDYDLAVVSVPGNDARLRQMDLQADLVRAGFDRIDMVFLDTHNVVLGHEAVRLNQLLYARPEFDAGSFFSRMTRLYLDFLPHLKVQREALKERLLHGTV